MDKKNARILWILILVAEAAMLAAMLLCDFGVLHSNINPLSAKGIIYHLLAVVIIVISVRNLKRIEK